MATQARSTAASAGERARLRKPQLGPVTLAIAASRDMNPEYLHLRSLRRSIAERIKADIALIDALDGTFSLGDAQ